LLPRGIVGTLQHWISLTRPTDRDAAADIVADPRPAE